MKREMFREPHIYGTDQILHEILLELRMQSFLLIGIDCELRRANSRPVHLTLTIDPRSEPLKLNENVLVTAAETDAEGKTLPIATGQVTFAVSDPTLATITDNGDGTATIVPIATGSVTITATDANNTLTGSVDIVITDPPAVLTVTEGAPFVPTPAAPAALQQ